jgi:hypothetical protein
LKKYKLAYLFIPVLLLLVYPLITGSDLLGYPLIKEPYLPLGTMSTWLFFVLFPLSIKWLSKPRDAFTYPYLGYVYHLLLGVSFWMGVFWPFVSFLLAENLSNTFNSGMEYFELRSRLFWYYAYITAGLPLLALVVLLFGVFNKAISGSRNTNRS